MLSAGTAACSSPEAEAFVRFCYQRRRVGWPELYDEMCAVATRGLYRGMGHEALAEIGVGFSLFETPRLARARDPHRDRGAGGAARRTRGDDRGLRGGAGGRGGRGRERTGGGAPGGVGRLIADQARILRRAISPSIWRSAST